MNMQSIRQSIFAALLVPPLSVLAQTPPAGKTASSTPPAHPAPQPVKLEYKLTNEQLQAIMQRAANASTETTADEPLSDVVVSGKEQDSAERKSPIAVKPCGLASVVWFIEHPAEGWRVFAPIAADSELNACLKPSWTATSSAYREL